jgi:hypothetical protein
MIYVFEDMEYADNETLKNLHKEVDDSINLIGDFIRYINNKKSDKQ